MKAGTIIKVLDGEHAGEVATVVYHGLDGYGAKLGRIEVDMSLFEGTNPLFGERPKDWPYDPDFMLNGVDYEQEVAQ